MKLAVIGSRAWKDAPLLRNILLVNRLRGVFTEVVSGGAAGADSMAQAWAESKDVPCTVFPAAWERYGKSAGFRRNAQIVEAADAVLAFVVPQACPSVACRTGTIETAMGGSGVCHWCRGRRWCVSTGTAHSIRLANAAGKTVTVVLPDGSIYRDFVIEEGA